MSSLRRGSEGPFDLSVGSEAEGSEGSTSRGKQEQYNFHLPPKGDRLNMSFFMRNYKFP